MSLLRGGSWDAFGTREAGFRVAWVNRIGQPALPGT